MSGRKRQIVVDTVGLLLQAVVTEGHRDDRKAAYWLLHCTRLAVPSLQVVWADAGYRQYDLLQRSFYGTGIWVEIVSRPPYLRSLPKRWLVERTFAWLSHPRRLSKDYEYFLKTSAAMLYAAMIRLMLRWLAAPAIPL